MPQMQGPASSLPDTEVEQQWEVGLITRGQPIKRAKLAVMMVVIPRRIGPRLHGGTGDMLFAPRIAIIIL